MSHKEKAKRGCDEFPVNLAEEQLRQESVWGKFRELKSSLLDPVLKARNILEEADVVVADRSLSPFGPCVYTREVNSDAFSVNNELMPESSSPRFLSPNEMAQEVVESLYLNDPKRPLPVCFSFAPDSTKVNVFAIGGLDKTVGYYTLENNAQGKQEEFSIRIFPVGEPGIRKGFLTQEVVSRAIDAIADEAGICIAEFASNVAPDLTDNGILSSKDVQRLTINAERRIREIRENAFIEGEEIDPSFVRVSEVIMTMPDDKRESGVKIRLSFGRNPYNKMEVTLPLPLEGSSADSLSELLESMLKIAGSEGLTDDLSTGKLLENVSCYEGNKAILKIRELFIKERDKRIEQASESLEETIADGNPMQALRKGQELLRGLTS